MTIKILLTPAPLMKLLGAQIQRKFHELSKNFKILRTLAPFHERNTSNCAPFFKGKDQYCKKRNAMGQ